MTSEMPLKYQVCTLEQAETLARLLGKHARGSLWKYAYYLPSESWKRVLSDEKSQHFAEKSYPAYTGDELGALFKNSAKWNEYPCYSTAKEKAALAIEGLTEGWIKPEDFKYPDFD